MTFQRALTYCYYVRDEYGEYDNFIIELRNNSANGQLSTVEVHHGLILRREYDSYSRCVEGKSYTVIDLGRAINDMRCKLATDNCAAWLEKIQRPLLETIWLNWRPHATLLYNVLARLNLQDLFAQCARWLLLNSSAL